MNITDVELDRLQGICDAAKTTNVATRLSETKEALAFMRNRGAVIPEEAAEMEEVFARCVEAESTLPLLIAEVRRLGAENDLVRYRQAGDVLMSQGGDPGIELFSFP